jgi:hypothetical protein
MALNIFEKPERLRRQTVPSSCSAVQLIKRLDRLAVEAELDRQFRRLCLSHAPPGSAVQAAKEAVHSDLQINYVTKEFQ